MQIIIILILFCTTVEAQNNNLKMLDINIWSGLDYNGTFEMGQYESSERMKLRFKLLVELIRNISPDVIFLQEVNPVDEISARLADSIKYDEIHQVCNAGVKIFSAGFPVNLKEGLVILAKKELKLKYSDSWKLGGAFGLFGDPLTIHFSEAHFALVGKILLNGNPLYLINTHLISDIPQDSIIKSDYKYYTVRKKISQQEYLKVFSDWKGKNKLKIKELEKLTSSIKNMPEGYPFILGGDFNSVTEDSSFLLFIKDNRLIDTFDSNNSGPKYSWNPDINENTEYSTWNLYADGSTKNKYDIVSSIYDRIPQRIDYIFLSGNFNNEDIESYNIIIDTSGIGIHISDHFGILSEINLNGVFENIRREYEELRASENKTIEPFPIISYDTDAGVGYGAKVFVLNQLRLNESLDVTAFNSTKGERWYRFVFSIPDLELRQGKKYPLAIDMIADYDKYIKNYFYGIGYKSSFNNKEEYTKEPFELALNFSRGITGHVVAQIGLKYKSVRDKNYDEKGNLAKVLSRTGGDFIKYISLNMNLRYDTRNSFINPSNGLVLSGEAEIAPGFTFTNTSFKGISAWFQYYSMLFYPKTILALRTSLKMLTGNNLPVQVLLPIGGSYTLRGYPQDRFLDKSSAVINAEFRFPIFGRLGGIAGYDAGKVWHSASGFDLLNWAGSPVTGLRFIMETFIIRLDVGFGKEGTGIYFNFGQVF